MWESFYTRCQSLILSDPNHAEFSAFQRECHPASVDTSDTLFSEDFEGGLSKWRGQSGNTPQTATIVDDKGNKVLKMNSCTGGGDAFSTDAFECSIGSPCLGKRPQLSAASLRQQSQRRRWPRSLLPHQGARLAGLLRGLPRRPHLDRHAERLRGAALPHHARHLLVAHGGVR